jgi:hypothetical protein
MTVSIRTVTLALTISVSLVHATTHAHSTAAKPDVKTITGSVVDAACFMIHPPVANSASHKECGAACIARGVPLAIAGDDGALYFPADGNKRLAEFHGRRVRVSGTVTEKSEPMELKMPVGDKNTMAVKVEGGYKVVAIESIANAGSQKL